MLFRYYIKVDHGKFRWVICFWINIEDFLFQAFLEKIACERRIRNRANISLRHFYGLYLFISEYHYDILNYDR